MLFTETEKKRKAFFQFIGRLSRDIICWPARSRPAFSGTGVSDKPRLRAYFTDANSRGQAIGFTVHRRLKVVSTAIYSQLQNIMGVPDLRPALRLDLYDTTTGLQTTAIAIHYKSDHGGGCRARPVRRQQAKAQIEAARITNEFVVCLGHYNQYLGVSTDTAPLIADGYLLCPRYDSTSTHKWWADRWHVRQECAGERQGDTV